MSQPAANADRPRPRLSRDTFAALRFRNYRLYFIGQFISMCGTWLQSVAQGWLVWEITHDPVQVGLVTACGSAPMFLCSLPGGVVADRVDRRRLVLVTQVLAMLLAALLGYLALQPHLEVWHVAVVAALLGIVNAFDMPARQSFVVETVDRRALMNAIALNSVLFNGARVVGPALGGLAIHVVGTAGCFFANAVSYVAAIIAIGLMRVPQGERAPVDEPPLQAMLAGLRYVSDTPVVRRLVVLLGTAAVFGYSVSVLLPPMADRVLGGDAGVYGWLMTAQGAGAVAGSLLLASLGDMPHRRRLVYGGLAVFAVSLAAFAFSRWLPLSLLAMLVSGAGMIVFSATSNTVVQSLVPDHLRGRIMGVWALVFAGSTPIGSLQAGYLAGRLGAPAAIGIGVAVILAGGMLVFRSSERERRAAALTERAAAAR